MDKWQQANYESRFPWQLPWATVRLQKAISNDCPSGKREKCLGWNPGLITLSFKFMSFDFFMCGVGKPIPPCKNQWDVWNDLYVIWHCFEISFLFSSLYRSPLLSCMLCLLSLCLCNIYRVVAVWSQPCFLFFTKKLSPLKMKWVSHPGCRKGNGFRDREKWEEESQCWEGEGVSYKDTSGICCCLCFQTCVFLRVWGATGMW